MSEDIKAEKIKQIYLAAVQSLQTEGLEITSLNIADCLLSAATGMIVAHCKEKGIAPDEERLWFKNLVRVPLGNGFDCEANFFFYHLETVFDEQGNIKLSDNKPSKAKDESFLDESFSDDFYMNEDEIFDLPPIKAPKTTSIF
jgi:hypothetical protein